MFKYLWPKLKEKLKIKIKEIRREVKISKMDGRPKKALQVMHRHIRKTGQNFIMMAYQNSNSGQLFSCKTQNELSEFTAASQSFDISKRSLFLKAFLYALHDEYYDAGIYFYDWIVKSDKGIKVDLYLWDTLVDYPIFSIIEQSPIEDVKSPADRAQLLFNTLKFYASTGGNDEVRRKLIEGIALGLSKYFGSVQDYETAKKAIDLALPCHPKSIYLRPAEYALGNMLRNDPVPERLMKFIGNDNGALLSKICPEPFKRFDISPNGDVLVCCGHWLPTTIGNLLTDSIEDILNSEKAQKIRASMLDGSYKYCNHLECTALIKGYLPDKASTNDPVLREAVDHDKVTINKVDQLLFAFDQTCNLSCPSCRTDLITEKKSLSLQKVRVVEVKLQPLLKGLKVLNINPAGELFVSNQSRRLLEMINREDCPDLMLDIISNGTKFSEKEFAKFPNLIGMIRAVRISIDAASKATFESLRRLGVWEEFTENMAFLKRLREESIIPQLSFSFTYQLGNFREMLAFVEFARKYNCDLAMFERLQNLGTFSWDEFRERAVHLSEHPLHNEFRNIIRDPVFASTLVWHDFDWHDADATKLQGSLQANLLKPCRNVRNINYWRP